MTQHATGRGHVCEGAGASTMKVLPVCVTWNRASHSLSGITRSSLNGAGGRWLGLEEITVTPAPQAPAVIIRDLELSQGIRADLI